MRTRRIALSTGPVRRDVTISAQLEGRTIRKRRLSDTRSGPSERHDAYFRACGHRSATQCPPCPRGDRSRKRQVNSTCVSSAVRMIAPLRAGSLVDLAVVQRQHFQHERVQKRQRAADTGLWFTSAHLFVASTYQLRRRRHEVCPEPVPPRDSTRARPLMRHSCGGQWPESPNDSRRRLRRRSRSPGLRNAPPLAGRQDEACRDQPQQTSCSCSPALICATCVRWIIGATVLLEQTAGLSHKDCGRRLQSQRTAVRAWWGRRVPTGAS